MFVFGVPVQVSTPPSSVGSVMISWGGIVGRKALAAASTRAAPVFRLLSSATEILSLPENKHAAQLLNGGKAACEVQNEEQLADGEKGEVSQYTSCLSQKLLLISGWKS